MIKSAITKLKDVALFQGLPDDQLQIIQNNLTDKSFNKGELIYSEGAECGRIFIVQSGHVKLYRLSASGKEQILETLGPGDTCACNPGSASWMCGSTAEAMTPTKVWFLSREDYVQLVTTNMQVSQTLNQMFAQKLQSFGNLIEDVSLKDAKKRLVKFILDMLGEPKPLDCGHGEKETLQIPFTREEIARRIGTSRETVARYLSQLRKSRLIEIRPRQIVVSSRKGLEKLLH